MTRRALVLVVVGVACGRAPAPYAIDQPHVTPDVSPADAKAALEAAIARGEAVAIIRAANAVADLAPWRDVVWSAIDRADEASLASIADALGDREPAGAVHLRLALLADHRGDAAAAAEHLAASARAADHALLPAREVSAVEEPDPDPKIIALLAPLSGPHAGIGGEVAAGAKLGVPAGTKLVTFDTKGEPDGAIAAVDAAIAGHAIAIVGPVGERESLAAARRAAERGIPIGLLAPADGADPGAGVFRLVSSPADEARMAVWLAAGESYPTAGVLAPRDDVGAAAAAAFVEAAGQRGISVTAVGDYDPSATDLEPDVKRFLGLDPLSNPRLRAHLRKYGKKGWQTFSPDVPFSLLYIPDRYDHAALVAAFLPYLGVELRTTEFADPDMLKRKHRGRIPQVVQLVGDGGWNDARILVRGGPAVEGALIVTTFGGELDAGPGGELAARFRDATGHTASAIAAQAHDAVRLVVAARDRAPIAKATGTARWAAVARAMVGTRVDDGACGAAEIDATGEVLRDPIVLQIDTGELTLAP